MDFQINIHTDYELHVEQFLHRLLERGYSQTTVNGYRSYLNRMKNISFHCQNQCIHRKLPVNLWKMSFQISRSAQAAGNVSGQASDALTITFWATIYYKEMRVVIPLSEMMINLVEDETHDYSELVQRQNKSLGNMLGCEIDFILNP